MFNPKAKADEILSNIIMSEIVEPRLTNQEEIDYVWESLVSNDYEVFNELCYLVGADYVANFFNQAVDSLAKETF